jgi:uncharacterized protein YjbI with pentapeptide repeats
MGVCKYSSPYQPAKLCGRYTAAISDLCEFHESNTSPSKLPVHEFFKKLINEYHATRQGDWRGFEFPSGIKFENLKVDYAIDLRGAKFGDITFENVHFKNVVDFSHCKFDGTVMVIAIFDADANFNECKFESRTSFSGSFNDHASFNGSMFNDAVTFSGGRDISVVINDLVRITDTADVSKQGGDKVENISFKLSRLIRSSLRSIVKKWQPIKKINEVRIRKDGKTTKIRRLFNAIVHMENVYFLRPERVKFMGVDLFRAHLIGTDMRGVHFYDVGWYQEELGRKGLQDEVLVKNSWDKNDRNYLYPRVEAEYRNIRVALEDNKDYSSATDFYVGEMETRRQRMGFFRKYLFSVEAGYRHLSIYGSSIWRAVSILAILIVLHTFLTCLLLANCDPNKISKMQATDSFWSVLTNSLKILTLQRSGPFIEIGGWQTSLDAVFQIIGPIQIALVVLAMRARIKRH